MHFDLIVILSKELKKTECLFPEDKEIYINI